MRFRTKLLAATAGAVLLVGCGIGVVSAATSSDQTSDREDRGADRDDTALSGNAAERAKAAATAAVPGATVRSVERDRDDDNPRVAYEVELVKPDGSSVEVELDANYNVLHLDRDHHTDSHDRDD